MVRYVVSVAFHAPGRLQSKVLVRTEHSQTAKKDSNSSNQWRRQLWGTCPPRLPTISFWVHFV